MAAALTILVGSADDGYPVLIGEGLLASLPGLLAERVGARRFAVVSDSNVSGPWAEGVVRGLTDLGLQASLFSFPAGEASKTRTTWARITDEMLDAGLGRDGCLVAVGGGVTTDVGGFVAATYMRGIPVVQVPTSYLAMIDASVGAKTGVDVAHGKNLVGAFHRPQMVVVDPTVLSTLSAPERAQGLVEALKHGAILDVDYFEALAAELDALMDARGPVALRAVARSVELKAAVVAEDEHEGGYRRILNFGHTIGHALEAASDYAMGHGSAVALGMIAEASIGERLGVTEGGTAERLESTLAALLGTFPSTAGRARVAPYLGVDKKARDGKPRFVLLGRLGRVDPGDGWTHAVPDKLVTEVLDSL